MLEPSPVNIVSSSVQCTNFLSEERHVDARRVGKSFLTLKQGYHAVLVAKGGTLCRCRQESANSKTVILNLELKSLRIFFPLFFE